MFLTKLKPAMVLVAALGLLATGLGLSAYRGFAQPLAAETRREPAKPVAREPVAKDADQADAPKAGSHYGWLVFGPKARARALVRLRGAEVAIDRDGDGKFDGKGERFQSEKDCKDVAIADPDGKTSYVIRSVAVLRVVPPETFLTVRADVRGLMDYTQECVVKMADDRKAAPRAHFHGPLTIAPKTWVIEHRAVRLVGSELGKSPWLQPLARLTGKALFIESTSPQSLARTGEPMTLHAVLATEGEGSFVVVASPDEQDGKTSPLPRGVRPFADVVFPAKKQGAPPIEKRYPLDHYRGGMFRGPVRVPDGAGVGKAKVTFSCDAWKGAKVAPTTVEIPIDDPTDDKK